MQIRELDNEGERTYIKEHATFSNLSDYSLIEIVYFNFFLFFIYNKIPKNNYLYIVYDENNLIKKRIKILYYIILYIYIYIYIYMNF